MIVWNTVYLEKIYTVLKNETWFDIKEFKRVSPLGTKHINFLGKYIFENTKINTVDGLRELEMKFLDN